MKHMKSILVTSIIIALIALSALAYLGTFTRWHADDFCIAATANELDAISFFNYWYQGWTGRFVYIPIAGILALGGPLMAGWLPAVTILIWLGVTYWAINPVFLKEQLRQPKLTAVLFSTLFLLILFSATPNLFQSMYWKDGLINYGFPLLGITAAIGCIIRVWYRKENYRYPFIPAFSFFLLAFMNGGFSEIFSTVQIAFYAFLFPFPLFFKDLRKRNDFWPFILAGLLGACCAYVVVLSAPGNQVRQELISDHPGFVRLLTFTVRNAVIIAAKFLLQSPFWAGIAIFVPFLYGYGSFKESAGIGDQGQIASEFSVSHEIKKITFVLVFAFVLSLAACAPVVYMLNAYPDDRSIIIPLFFIITATMGSSALVGNILRTKIREKIYNHTFRHLAQKGGSILMVVVIACSAIIYFVIKQLPAYRDYASRWDTRHQELLLLSSQGEQRVEVFGLENRFGISDLRVESDYWVNRCMADYYGFAAIDGK